MAKAREDEVQAARSLEGIAAEAALKDKKQTLDLEVAEARAAQATDRSDHLATRLHEAEVKLKEATDLNVELDARLKEAMNKGDELTRRLQIAEATLQEKSDYTAFLVNQISVISGSCPTTPPPNTVCPFVPAPPTGTGPACEPGQFMIF